jgi:hypothetical protein
MRIHDLGRPLAQLLWPGRSSTNPARTDAAAEPLPETPEPPSPDRARPAAWRDILSRYDMTQISPREFSELVQELHAGNHIGRDDAKDLAMIRLELDRSGLDPERPIDLLEYLSDKLDREAAELDTLRDVDSTQPAERSRREIELRTTQGQLNWIERFAAARRA